MDFGRNEGSFNQQHNSSETSPIRQVSNGLWPCFFYLSGFSMTRSLNDDLPQAHKLHLQVYLGDKIRPAWAGPMVPAEALKE